MGIDVLGALRVGGSTPSLQRRDQVVLCALALHPGDVLSADRLADALWGDEPPRSWSKVVQGCVLRIRRALGPSSIETTAAGYRLTLADDEIDSRRFEEFVDRGVALVATGEFDRATVVFSRALDLWRGPPFEVLDSWSPGRIEAARLDELRRSDRGAPARCPAGVWGASRRGGDRRGPGRRGAAARAPLGDVGPRPVPLRPAGRRTCARCAGPARRSSRSSASSRERRSSPSSERSSTRTMPSSRRRNPRRSPSTARTRDWHPTTSTTLKPSSGGPTTSPRASSDCGPARYWSSPVRRVAASRRSPAPVWCRHSRGPATSVVVFVPGPDADGGDGPGVGVV